MTDWTNDEMKERRQRAWEYIADKWLEELDRKEWITIIAVGVLTEITFILIWLMESGTIKPIF
jgi:hypothetical protein